MKLNFLSLFTLTVLLTSCNLFVPKYGINARTSEIGLTYCKSPEQYDRIIDSMAIELKGEVLDSTWQMIYYQLDTGYYMAGDVLYLKDDPKELVLVNYYRVLAVYNPSLCKEASEDERILNGLSTCLDSLNKIRIEKRVRYLFK